MKTIRKYTSTREDWDIVVMIRLDPTNGQHIAYTYYVGVDTPPAERYEAACLEDAIGWAKDKL